MTPIDERRCVNDQGKEVIEVQQVLKQTACGSNIS